MNSDWKTVPIPARMQHLRRDKRGYPIPAMVLVAIDGTPHFTVNDQAKRLRLITTQCCSICGTRLYRGKWFAGGPLSAFHAHGAYFDPPMHHECMQYAMQVCPWLALPNFTKQISAESMAKATGDRLLETTMIPGKPDVFVAVMSSRFKLGGNHMSPTLIPKRPYMAVEYWKDGKQLPQADGQALVGEALLKPLPALQPARMVLPHKELHHE